VPTIVPIIFAVLTPIAFSTSGSLAKHLSQERIGFDSNVLSFTSQALINGIILIIGITYWSHEGIKYNHLWLGLLSGISESVGKALIQYAISIGPGGPASAICAINAVYLALYEHLANARELNLVEILALIFCMLGATAVALPNHFDRIFKCCRKEETFML
jgi:drug/metabolite transporter (DMT)-like permease